MSELKPCDCSMPIDEYLRIQELWSGYGDIKIGVVYCSYCYNAKAFEYDHFSKPDEISKAAYKAWNTRQVTDTDVGDTPSIEDIVDVVEAEYNKVASDVKERYHNKRVVMQILKRSIAAIRDMDK